MQTRILDLDGSLVRQDLLVQRSRASVLPLQEWGPLLRLSCAPRFFRRYEECLTALCGSECDSSPFLNFIGSGDFHHVSLALLRRLPGPCNLLVIDNHPDWMRGVPFLHCGTWLYQAAQLPVVQRIIHVGGDVDFDNSYHWLAPWEMLYSGKIVVVPARRPFRGRRWERVAARPLRRRADEPARREAIEEFIKPLRDSLAARPLYISLDKDVLTAAESVVNWDSGHLTSSEVMDVIQAFRTASGAEVAGMDVVGDWSPVRLKGLLRRLLHWAEHPHMMIDPDEATRRNEALNLLLMDCVTGGHLAAVRSDGILRTAA